MDWWSTLLVVMTSHCIDMGWYKNIVHTPLYLNSLAGDQQENNNEGADPKDDQERGPDEVLPPEARPRGHNSAEEAFNQRRKTQGTMHLVCNILASRSSKVTMAAVVCVTEVTRKAHDSCVSQLKTQAGAVEWHRRVVVGGWQEELKELVEVMHSRKVLAHMGLPLGNKAMPENDLEIVEAIGYARFLFDFIVERMVSTVLFGQYYAFGIPGCFGAQSSKQPGEAQEKLRYLSMASDMFEALEKKAAADPYFDNIAFSMLWPRNTWSREVLLSAAENNFQQLNTVTASEVLAFSRCMKSTKLIEDLGNQLRTAERQHIAAKLGRVARWHQMVNGGVLADSDLRQLEPTAQDKVNSKASLPKGIFTPSSGSFSLGGRVTEQFVSRAVKWASPAAEHLSDTVLLTRAAIELRADLDGLKRCWFGLLAMKGKIIHKLGAGEGSRFTGVVLHVSEWGIIVAGVTPHVAGAWRYFKLGRPAHEMQHHFVVITDWGGWWVKELLGAP